MGIRDLASIICTVYYLIAAEQADEKVRKVRAVLTVDHLRVAWNKPTTPYLSYFTSLIRPNFTKYKPRRIRKAPEYPYPYALNECFDVYTQIVATKGRCIGMKPDSCPRIVITGDSAGGNLATGTTLMIIQANLSATSSSRGFLPSPAGLVLLYPALDMNIGSWMTDDQMALIRAPGTAKKHSNFVKRKSEDIDRRYTPSTPRPADDDPDFDFFATPRPKRQSTDVEAQKTAVAESKPQPLRTRLAVSSIISYFGDRIITPEMM